MPRRRDRVRRFERPEQPRGEAAGRGEELRAARRAEHPAADDVPRGRAECESRAGAVTLATEPQSTQRKQWATETPGHREPFRLFQNDPRGSVAVFKCESRAGAVTLATEARSTQRTKMGHRHTRPRTPIG